ncbi:glycosyltransferase family 2 protein [Alkalihalobacterium bogoriense]|uniref:glycosyltransferase family 2 protein n=1 Tax=Alkalihalobacterium bogoriense TaxID=246272 RepID=UPI000A6EFD60|nr:glycosyltransferase [Alkalihalobacterium bogoriense]
MVKIVIGGEYMKDVKKDYPSISVITPTYNSGRFIKETIDSVLNQTFENWEMIIVDDCSSDNTIDIINDYIKTDGRIRLIQLSINSGPAVARNTAIKNAKGRYIAFLDSDDVWYPEKLERQLQFMENSKVAFSFSKYENINESGTKKGTVEDIPEKVTYKQLLKNNVIGCLTVMLDRDQIKDVEMINIRTRQDYVLWLSLTKRGFTAYGLQEVLAKYRNVQHSVSSNKFKMAKQNWKVYRQIEQLSFFKSTWYFLQYVFSKLRKYS